MTTRRSSRKQQQWGGLQAVLVVGSLVATLAGTRLLSLQEPVETAVSADAMQTVSVQEPTVVIVPTDSSLLPLPPDGARGVQVELKPIAQAVTPDIQPVARASSSR
ncbi:MAG: hypothetical protein DWQ04_11205 [Chloroflexi bacterium]|nr:MAG: hypothetical protein DWQ04_11205 [Chloroflexota bacterium]